jgi:hypothetical protein
MEKMTVREAFKDALKRPTGWGKAVTSRYAGLTVYDVKTGKEVDLDKEIMVEYVGCGEAKYFDLDGKELKLILDWKAL